MSKERRRGLIVDDTDETLDLLRDATRSWPCDIDFFDNAFDASISLIAQLKDRNHVDPRLRTHPYDFYLLDLAMKDATGFMVARILRELEREIGIARPAIVGVVTAFMETAEMSSEFQKYDIRFRMTKPIEIEELTAVVDGWLSALGKSEAPEG
ncbi:MAG TPA: response regulator [Pyrinomonadaceae bacterium]